MTEHEIEIRLVFLSDWFIGTGSGRVGAVDALVLRDEAGLPYVPAKTLTGILRDACETVADAFDTADGDRVWNDWVTWIFGSQPSVTGDPARHRSLPPQPAALTLTDARADEDLRRAARCRPALQQAAVLLRPGVKLDQVSGTAEEDFLRLEERARRGTELIAVATAPAATPTRSTGSRTAQATPPPVEAGRLPAEAELLLRAGARLVESLGGKRNRGAGRVAILLPGVCMDSTALAREDVPDDPRLTELLDSDTYRQPGVPPPTQDRGPRLAVTGPDSPGERQVVHRVVVEAMEPLVIGDRTFANVVTTRAFVPGTMLLGQVLSRLSGPRPFTPANVRVSNAEPAVQTQTGSVPAHRLPLSLMISDKGGGDTVFDATTGPPPPRERAKHRPGYAVHDGDRTWKRVSLARTSSVHAVIDDAQRRPTSEGGGVFCYEGIAPRTRLVFDVVIPAEAGFHLKANDSLHVGRSVKDGFGHIRVVSVESQSEPEGGAPRNGPHTVRVLSDTILLDSSLRPDPTPDALVSELKSVLGTPVTPDPDREAFTDVARRDSFHSRWGTRSPTQLCLAAGSVVPVLLENADHNKLSALEREGIGERTAEGFGRIQVVPPVPEKAKIRNLETPRQDGPAEAVPQPPEHPHPWELAAWRSAVAAAVAQIVTGDAPEEIRHLRKAPPSHAQLGSLRGQVLDAAARRNGAALSSWLDATAAVARRSEQWGDALPEVRALLLDDRPRLWRLLKLAGAQPSLVLAEGREDAIRDQLWWDAAATLVVALCNAIMQQPEQENRDDA